MYLLIDRQRPTMNFHKSIILKIAACPSVPTSGIKFLIQLPDYPETCLYQVQGIKIEYSRFTTTSILRDSPQPF